MQQKQGREPGENDLKCSFFSEQICLLLRNSHFNQRLLEKIWTVLEGRLRSEFSWSVDKLKAAEVTDISLGYCVIRTKNEEDIGSSIPAWLVTVRSETKTGLVQYSDFMINAVTGEFIQTDADHK